MSTTTTWEVIGYLLPGGSGTHVVTPVLRDPSEPKRFFFPKDPATDVSSQLIALPQEDERAEQRLGGGPNFCLIEEPIKYSTLGVYIAQAPKRGLSFAYMQASQAEDLINAAQDRHSESLEKLEQNFKDRKKEER